MYNLLPIWYADLNFFDRSGWDDIVLKGEIIGINEEDKIDIPDIYADHNIHNENEIDSNSEENSNDDNDNSNDDDNDD